MAEHPHRDGGYERASVWTDASQPGPTGGVLVSNLRGSAMHTICVDLYVRHRPTPPGHCAACGHIAPCPPRRHATKVIEAAGEDPAVYDQVPPDQVGNDRGQQPGYVGPRHAAPAAVAGMPGVDGWAIGRRVTDVGNYER